MLTCYEMALSKKQRRALKHAAVTKRPLDEQTKASLLQERLKSPRFHLNDPNDGTTVADFQRSVQEGRAVFSLSSPRPDDNDERRALTAIINMLFSVIGVGVAVFYFSYTYRLEIRVLMTLGSSALVLLAELYFILPCL